MNVFLNRAKELENELIDVRRKIHSYGGIGFDIEPTTELVVSSLKSYGYAPELIAKTGVTCTVGKPGKTFLLRADMDALPMTEENDLPFKCTNGTAHTCGHDCHTAMLIIAAKMLKERENELSGMVKFMFQPGEEGHGGARAMIEEGVLENPNVDGAFAIHVTVGRPDFPTGAFRYCSGSTLGATDQFHITINGIGCHGAYPSRGVDPISIGSKIVTAIQHLIAMETPVTEQSVITFGKFHSGSAHNIIPYTAELVGTIRTLSNESREFLLKRFREVVEGIAKTFRADVDLKINHGDGICFNDPQQLPDIKRYVAEIVGEDMLIPGQPINGSEDFAAITQRVPSNFFFLGAGDPRDGYTHGAHQPKMVVDESALYLGAAALANVAFKWLQEHSQ